jgi:magnesium chelatase family protein
MVAKVKTFTFLGVDTVDVDVEVKLTESVNISFNIVGLPDKAINEAKERVRSAILSMGLAFPPKRITVNLSPADVMKEGSYLDLPIALGILIEMGILHQDVVDEYVVLGELSLDGSVKKVNGILPSAISAKERGLGIICTEECGSEALWAGEDIEIIAINHLLQLINHLTGNQFVNKPVLNIDDTKIQYPDLSDVYGQEQPKRALEIAAAGGHNMLMVGPPGTGKSMLAQRILSILPDLTAREILETNVIHSVAGNIIDGKLNIKRPFLDPHHSCSMPAMVGGGAKPRPGQISLAHNGILFLDELPEFPRQVLDSLRQPLETGRVSIARATANITYPASFQLIAAMNPCRCGNLGEGGKTCKRAPECAREYQSKISGPLLDRFD